MLFSSSSDDEALQRELSRNQRQRNRRRERDEANVSGGPHASVAQAMAQRVLVGDAWIDVRVGTVFHVAKGTYVSVLEAQRHAARYFGDPNCHIRHRAFRDPKTVILRCAAMSTTDANVLPHTCSAAGVRGLPRVKLSEACVRSFYLALDDDDDDDDERQQAHGASSGTVSHQHPRCARRYGPLLGRNVPACGVVHPKAPRPSLGCVPMQAGAAACSSDTRSNVVRVGMTSDTAAVVPDLLVGGCIAMGTVVGADGSLRLGILTASQLVFARNLDVVDGPHQATVACTTSYPRMASNGIFAKDVALLVFSKQHAAEYLFQREYDGVGTQLGRRARGSTVPDALSVCGLHDAVGPNPVEALVVHGPIVTILAVTEMRGRMLALPRESQTVAIASTERNAVGSNTHMLIGGTRRRDLFCLLDDPRMPVQRAMRILTPASHAGGRAGAAAERSGVQAVVMQGDFGFLSIESNGHCKVWDLRALGASPSSSESARPVLDFNSVRHRVSEGVDVGCSYAVWGPHIAVSNSVGRAKVFCRRTGQMRHVVEHGSLGRAGAMALLQPDTQPHLAASRLMWCGSDAQLYCAALQE